MRAFRDLSIKRKLAVIIVLTSSVALLLACTAFATFDVLSLRSDMVNDLSTMAEVIGVNSTAALVFHDQAAAQEALGALRAVPPIVSAGIFAKDGTVFATYRRADPSAAIHPPAHPGDGHRFGDRDLLVFRPILLDGERIGTLYIQSDMQELEARLTLYGGIVLVVLLASLLAAFALSGTLQRVISEPITQLVRTMKQVSSERDYAVRAGPHGQDEVGTLIDGLNEMLAQIQDRDASLQRARDELELRVTERTKELQQEIIERIRLQQQLLHAQKLEAVGQLAGGIAHDFNNLLQVILGNTEFAAANLPAEHPGLKNLQSVKHAGRRAAELTTQLLAFSQRSLSRPQPLNLGELVHQVTLLLRRTFDPLIRIDTRVPENVWTVRADQSQMHQVLMNLCVNARDAMPDGGCLTIGLENLARGDHQVVRLTVSDTGTGMDTDTCRRIFEPFFTTKGIGKGTGLGLATVYGIVMQHGGTIAVDSALGRGSRFVIELARHSSAGAAVTPAPAPPRPGRGETVLVVDDKKAIRDLTRAILEESGYMVLEAADGEQALAVYQQERPRIVAVILDSTMPKRSGTEVLAELRKIEPAVRVILCSGYSAEAQGLDVTSLGAKAFLQKPYSSQDLSQTLRRVLDQEPTPPSATTQ